MTCFMQKTALNSCSNLFSVAARPVNIVVRKPFQFSTECADIPVAKAPSELEKVSAWGREGSSLTPETRTSLVRVAFASTNDVRPKLFMHDVMVRFDREGSTS